MNDIKREQLIDSLQGFEHQAKIAIARAREVRKALQDGNDDKAERACGDLDFAASGLNGWMERLPLARVLLKTCSQCRFFGMDYCRKASSHVLGSADACQHFSQIKGGKQ